MAKSIFTGLGNANVGFGSTFYPPIVGVFLNNSTETRVQYPTREAGDFNNLAILVHTNSANGSSTVTFRKNTADTALVVTITASTTGVFEDTSNTVSVTAGDLVNLKVVVGGSSGNQTIGSSFVTFNATSNTVTKFIGASTGTTYNSSTTIQYLFPPSLAFQGTEANAQYYFGQSGTTRNLFLRVSSNSRVLDTVFKSRKNGADGNLIITVGGTLTGTFEDTSNSDTISAGDLYNLQIQGGLEALSLTFTPFSFDFVNTGGYTALGGVGTLNQGSTTNRFSTLNHGISSVNVEANVKVRIKEAFTASMLGIYVSANSSVTPGTCDLRINGASSALTIAIPTATTGWFMDSTHSVSVAVGDDADIRVVNPSTGSITSQSITMLGLISSGSAIKTFNGLAYASTKTVNGLAIASVKTWNGLA
jgi:hypothetical protein